MVACKTGSSEIHNLREKALSYVVPEKTHLNESAIHERIHDSLARIEATYTEVTGQKMQLTASPLKEAVLVIKEDTTMEQVMNFGEMCRQELGITPIQYHIHRDEGHYDSSTYEWKPNIHAHIVFDCTCRDHRMVERTAKTNGRTVKKKNGKPEKKLVDNFGKTIKLSKADMSRMQDLAAKATGMKRGVPSDKEHMDAQRYKAQVLAEEVKSLEVFKTDLGHKIDNLKEDISAKESEMRKIDVLSSVKKTLTAALDRTADGIGVSDRVKNLEQQVAEGHARIEALKQNTYSKEEVTTILAAKDNELNSYRTHANSVINGLRNENQQLKTDNNKFLTKLINVAKILITHYPTEQLVFESIGLVQTIGRRIWDNVVDREGLNRGQEHDNNRGIRR